MLRHLRLWLLTALLLALSIGAWAQTVSTDQLDYAPGETVQITGSGFHPNETITLIVDATDGISWDFGEPWTATTDANGNFTATWFVIDAALNRAFLLTADCPDGLHAETAFTDGPKVG